MGTAGAEIVRPRAASLDQHLEGAYVRLGEVRDMDVVAQTGAVRRRVIVAEHLEFGAACRRRDGTRDEMDLWSMILADLSARIRARGVEVTEHNRAQAVRTLEMPKRALHGQLGLSIAVDR